MCEALELAEKYARFKSPVLLLGETGTGKSILAKWIHEKSARKGTFVPVNCAAIPESLIESEFFGHVKGAFTDAGAKIGLVELADGGSLLLEEIGELPLRVQAKLLWFLDNGEFRPVGDEKVKQVDVRIIAATNRDLLAMMAQGAFRPDLFYRLNFLPIRIPPLREHSEDIPALVESKLSELNAAHGAQRSFTPAALDCFLRYPFPGNLRELAGIVARLVANSSSETIDIEAVRAELGDVSLSKKTFRQLVREFKRRLVLEALRLCGTQEKAAEHLGTSQPTVARYANPESI